MNETKGIVFRDDRLTEVCGMVYGPDHGFHPGKICMEEGRIRQMHLERTIFDPAKEELPEEASYIIPGLIDIHFHGCMGMDFCDGTKEALRTIAAWEVSQGVTSICPATLTLPPEELLHILRTAADFAEERRISGAGAPLADLIGINMEGPFISHTKKGAQNGKYILPCSAELARQFVETSGGLVKIIGLAPEENPDYEDFICEVKDDVHVSLAHTNADYDTALSAFQAGACHAVHLYNAMPDMMHRDPGVIGAVRDCPHVTAELICDGNHVHPAAIRAAFDMLGDERIVLISDSLRAAGMGDGEILLGGQRVSVHGSRAVLVDGGNLAGSVTSLMGCLKKAVTEMGIPLASAVRCATENPARVIGALDTCGLLRPGRKADLVLLDQDLNVKMVTKNGFVAGGEQ